MVVIMKKEDKLVTQDNTTRFSENEIALIKNTVAKNATDDELKLFLYQCNRTKLDPLSHQIWFIKTKDQLNIMTSIDGLRVLAERSGIYAGQDAPVFTKHENDFSCSVTVYKFSATNERYPVATGVAFYKEYKPKYSGSLWDSKPRMMLSKVAESIALRKAFPQDLAGLYTTEEFNEVRPQVEEPVKTKVILEEEKEEEINNSEKESFIEELEREISTDPYVGNQECPMCHNGYLIIRKGKYGEFLGCDQYPTCSYIQKLPKKS